MDASTCFADAYGFVAAAFPRLLRLGRDLTGNAGAFAFVVAFVAAAFQAGAFAFAW
jgi:hypothetical protein